MDIPLRILGGDTSAANRLVRRVVGMLPQAGIPPRVGRKERSDGIAYRSPHSAARSRHPRDSHLVAVSSGRDTNELSN